MKFLAREIPSIHKILNTQHAFFSPRQTEELPNEFEFELPEPPLQLKQQQPEEEAKDDLDDIFGGPHEDYL